MHRPKTQLEFLLTTLRKNPSIAESHKTLQYFHFLFYHNFELWSGMRLESTALIVF